MDRNNLGDMLKFYRKLNRLKVNDVTLLLKENYNIELSAKTIYGWESNQNPPSADKFLCLCEIYKIPDINFTFLKKQGGKTVQLSKDERLLIEHYREHPEIQGTVRKLLEMPAQK